MQPDDDRSEYRADHDCHKQDENNLIKAIEKPEAQANAKKDERGPHHSPECPGIGWRSRKIRHLILQAVFRRSRLGLASVFFLPDCGASSSVAILPTRPPNSTPPKNRNPPKNTPKYQKQQPER
jgi:hypothetical protein